MRVGRRMAGERSRLVRLTRKQKKWQEELREKQREIEAHTEMMRMQWMAVLKSTPGTMM